MERDRVEPVGKKSFLLGQCGQREDPPWKRNSPRCPTEKKKEKPSGKDPLYETPKKESQKFVRKREEKRPLRETLGGGGWGMPPLARRGGKRQRTAKKKKGGEEFP